MMRKFYTLVIDKKENLSTLKEATDKDWEIKGYTKNSIVLTKMEEKNERR